MHKQNVYHHKKANIKNGGKRAKTAKRIVILLPATKRSTVADDFAKARKPSRLFFFAAAFGMIAPERPQGFHNISNIMPSLVTGNI